MDASSLRLSAIIAELKRVRPEHLQSDLARMDWRNVVLALGYHGRRYFGDVFQILLGIQASDGGGVTVGRLKTRDLWHQLYLLDGIVAHLRGTCGGKGERHWCVRVLGESGDAQPISLYLAFVLCQSTATSHRIHWFVHSAEEEAAVALDYLHGGLIRDGSELRQLDAAIAKTRLGYAQNGTFNALASSGYQILDQARGELNRHSPKG